MVADTHELLYESDVIRAARLANQSHVNLFGCVMALPVVALEAGADQVLPRVHTPIDFWYHVVNSHLSLLPAAILASSAITLDDILASKHNPLNRNFYIKFKPDYRGNRNSRRLGSKDMTIRRLYDLRLAEIKHYHGTPYAAYGDRLKILVENQYLLVKHTLSEC